RRMIKALFPDLDVPKAFQKLAEQQCRTEATIQRLGERIESGFTDAADEHKGLEGRVDVGFVDAAEARQIGFAEAADERKRLEGRMDAGFAEAADERKRLEGRMDAGFAEAAEARRVGFAEAADDRREIKQTMGSLKGKLHEQSYHLKADAVFGIYLKRGRKAASAVGEQLHEAVKNGTISAHERVKVMAADLLWIGRPYESEEDIILVVEASWLAEETDVTRSAERAGILREVGLRALPVVAAQEWADGIPKMARERRVVMVTDGRIEGDSWQAALT
ncbi:MAG: hypothetical protein U9R15_04380, partial [Chloroflexota bacterium]|nr:hypothetical protein [Chloroflexota bacterium]